MHRVGLNRLTLVTTVICLMLAWSFPASAQDPRPSQQDRAAMAAIPLITSDLPDGYRFAGEGFVPAGTLPGVDTAALTAAGFGGMYVSVYRNPDTSSVITSYVSQWPDAAAAEKGFALLEDEAATAPNGKTSDAPLDAGTGSAELTTGTTQSGDATMAVADATFVVDRYVVGVSVETPQDAAMDEAGVKALVDSLDGRAGAVAQGKSPEGTDTALPPNVLDLRPLGSEVQAGFLSSGETEALYGLSGSSLSGLTASWVSGVAIGDNGAAPYVVIAASSFPDADTAARVVEQSGDLAPVTLALQPVDFAVDGADSAKGFQYASPASTDGALDSFRGVIQTGSTMIVVDVQGASTADDAQAAARDLLAAQVACNGDTCQLPELKVGS